MREHLSTKVESKSYTKYPALSSRGEIKDMEIEVTPALVSETGFHVGDIIRHKSQFDPLEVILVVGASGGERFTSLWGIRAGRKYAELIDKSDKRALSGDLKTTYEVVSTGESASIYPHQPPPDIHDQTDGTSHKKTSGLFPWKKEPTTMEAIKEPKAVTAIEQTQDTVLILNTKVEVNKNPTHPALVPSIASFEHFSHDAPTLSTLEKCATAVQLRLPCLLEGETAASKTSSIEYLASLTRNPIFRLNLNGQTDTSELIGKFVPNEGDLSVAFNDLLHNIGALKPESIAIVERANKEGRGLSKLESQKIANEEGLKVSDWRWQDGIIPCAMKTGGWVILDEINLAEPQVLERLNSVLEVPPALTVSEHDSEKIGEGSQNPVHEGFRIFATMNPAEYSGRAPMSPAYKDRWQAYRFCPTPGKEEYGHMFSVLIYGIQPEVRVDGELYKNQDTVAKYPELAKIQNLEEFLGRLAQFHSKVAELARTRQIGKDFKEPYIFTRRGLLALIAFLNNKRVVDRKNNKEVTTFNDPKVLILRGLKDFYLDKMRNSVDKSKLEDQLASLGLSTSNWNVNVKPGKDPSSIWNRLGGGA
jgi:MoxR-like ATPase